MAEERPAQSRFYDPNYVTELLVTELNGRKPGFDEAMFIAVHAFYNKPDRSGQSYLKHLLQMYRSGTQSNTKMIIGILHDLLEDTEWKEEHLKRIGFSDNVCMALRFVTKGKHEPYFAFIERVGRSVKLFGESHYVIDPKIEDLTHNMSVSRETGLLRPSYIKKLDVYIVARNYLVAIKQGEIEPGTSVRDFVVWRPELYDEDLLRENNHPPNRRGHRPIMGFEIA